MEKGNKFASGTSVDYQPSEIVIKSESSQSSPQNKPHLATKLQVGPRLYSHQVVCLANARPYHLADLAPADGKWRILIFGGDIVGSSACGQRLESLSRFLGEDRAKSPILRFTPFGQDSDSVIDCITILASRRVLMEPDQFHEVLRPIRPQHGFRSYQKM